eukprot:GHUV01035527.1.p1 GENE.GHUV01035527.1~~GHUV01035527.1.p1  ORF type:complete len:118 (+),score=17.66 GHUV01035527.1:275-628(+)
MASCKQLRMPSSASKRAAGRLSAIARDTCIQNSNNPCVALQGWPAARLQQHAPRCILAQSRHVRYVYMSRRIAVMLDANSTSYTSWGMHTPTPIFCAAKLHLNSVEASQTVAAMMTS